MSVLVTGLVWKHAQVGKSALLILLAMADIASDDGSEIWPSVETLAAKARCDVRQVTRAIQLLESLGLIELVQAHSGRAGHFKSWRINIDRVVSSCPEGLYGPRKTARKPVEKTTGQNVRCDLSTGQNRRWHRTFPPKPPDISAAHIDNRPRPVLNSSLAVAARPAEGPADARKLWQAVEAQLGNVKFASHCGLGTPILDDGRLVVKFPSLFRAERAQAVIAEIERAAGVPVVIRVAA